MPHSPKATISLAAIRHNLARVKQLAPNSKVMAVIKADAYGHGLIEIATALVAAEGLAVARLEEALQLREANITQRILLLGGIIDTDSLQLCANQQLDIVIHSWESIEILLASSLKTPINIWLKLDSGMHRLGLTAEQFRRAETLLRQSHNVAEITLMTHFSAAEDSNHYNTNKQLAVFKQATEGLDTPHSLANSAAIIRHPQTRADWIRPGIMLFGASPLSTESQSQFPVDLHAVMTLSTVIIAIRNIEQGDSVGYNSRWVAQRPTTLATISMGYGDGYPRHAKNGTPILVNGQRAKLVGTVSMDLITVDITDCGKVNIGDEAILWGNDLLAEEIAAYADTISYELFTSISKRVPRVYC